MPDAIPDPETLHTATAAASLDDIEALMGGVMSAPAEPNRDVPEGDVEDVIAGICRPRSYTTAGWWDWASAREATAVQG